MSGGACGVEVRGHTQGSGSWGRTGRQAPDNHPGSHLSRPAPDAPRPKVEALRQIAKEGAIENTVGDLGKR